MVRKIWYQNDTNRRERGIKMQPVNTQPIKLVLINQPTWTEGSEQETFLAICGRIDGGITQPPR